MASALLANPLIEIGSVLTIIVGLQWAGFDAWGALQAFLRIPSQKREIMADGRNGLQIVLSSLQQEMQTLTSHFNHETTDNQEGIVRHLEDLHDKVDRTNQLLGEIKEYGLKCRKD